MTILEAVKTILREWNQYLYSPEWSEVTITVRKDSEGNIIEVGKTARIVGIRPEHLGYEVPWYLELDPVKPVITRSEDGSVNYDYTRTK